MDTNKIGLEESTFKLEFNNFMSSLFLYGILFFVLTFNLVAMSISLHVNIDKTFSKKLGSALFAFLFGLVYIVFNYFLYYIVNKNKVAKLYSKEKMFPWY
jgi:glucan phosphoethanolaminetransferase (alkaline phosphatase superfamily)